MLARQMIVDTSHDERTAVTVSHFADFIHGKPPGTEYARVQRPLGVVIRDSTDKGKAEEDRVIGARVPAVNAQHRLRHKGVPVSSRVSRIAPCIMDSSGSRWPAG